MDKLLLAEYHQAQLLHEMLPQIQIDRPILAPLNQETLHQPIVTIMHQPEGTTYPDPFTVNLAAQPDGPQTRAIEVVIER